MAKKKPEGAPPDAPEPEPTAEPEATATPTPYQQLKTLVVSSVEEHTGADPAAAPNSVSADAAASLAVNVTKSDGTGAAAKTDSTKIDVSFGVKVTKS